MPCARTVCSPWHFLQASVSGWKPCIPSAWQVTQAIFCSSKWIRWPRELPTWGQFPSWERWQEAQEPISTGAWAFVPAGDRPATKARSMASPCSGVEWWQRWQATLLWVPPAQRENSGLARWHCAQRRGSLSTKRFSFQAPDTTARRRRHPTTTNT